MMLWKSILAGVLAGWGFHGFNTHTLSLYSFAPLFTLGGFCILGYLLKKSARPSRSAYIFGIAYHGVSLSWVGSAFDYTTIPWIKYGISLLGGSYLAWQFFLSAYLAKKITKSAEFNILLFCILFAFFDLVRIAHPLLFPWNPMGFIAGDFCLSSVRFFGIFGLSLIMILFSQLPHLSRKWQIGIGSLVATLVVDHYIYQKQPRTFSQLYGRIVQPCIDQNFKWQIEKFEKNAEVFYKLSHMPRQGEKLQFVLWPESALPVYHTPEISGLIHLVPSPIPLIVGHVHVLSALGVTHTSLSLLTHDKGVVSTYDKRYLVPFGEYVPFAFIQPIIPFITDQRMNISPGKRQSHMDLSAVALPDPHVLICYESIFPQAIEGYRSWMIGVSNDAWFGTSYGPYQHLRWNQIRCLENNIPMVRSTNHGISCVIDGQGRIVKHIPLNQCGVLDHFVPAASGPSFYNRVISYLSVLSC